jgi:hypothetical protein
MSPPAREPRRSRRAYKQLRTSRQTRKGAYLQQQPCRSGAHAPGQQQQQQQRTSSILPASSAHTLSAAK